MAQYSPYSDPSINEIGSGFLGNSLLAARNSTVMSTGMRMAMEFEDMFLDTSSDPLNMVKSRNEYNPTADPMSYSMGNNPEGIAEAIKDIPYSEWSWLLTSKSFNQFESRVQFLKAGLPEAQSVVPLSARVAAGATDVAALMAAGIAAEPLALIGLGARTTLAGRAAAASNGMWRLQHVSKAAAEAAATVSRTNLTARFTALGVAEEAVYQAIKNGVDPLYDPDAGDVLFDLTIAGSTAGLVGGTLFGRAFLRSHIEDAANDMRRLRTTELPGGYTITYADHLRFSSPAAADQMLFAPGATSLSDEVARIGSDLSADFQRRADLGVVDLNIPGTRTIGIGEVPVAGAPRAVRTLIEEVPVGPQKPLKPTIGTTAKPSVGIRSAIKAAAFELSLAGVELNPQVFTAIGRALVDTYGMRLSAGAFNKEFWNRIISDLPPEIVEKLRPIKERAFIPGIDRTVRDAALSEDMVESVWNHFRAGTHLRPDSEKSLIFQVLQEIRSRGGMVNRQVVGEVIDELRQIAQNPPKRVNVKGKTVMDKNARRLAVAKIVNRRTEKLKRGATEAKPVYIPASLVDRMSMPSTGGVGIGAAAGGLDVPTTGGARPDFSDIPQSRQWYERIPILGRALNQSALLLESNNGAARLIGWLTFNARRSFDKAQAQTIFESGTAMLHKTMFTFMRGYRNGFIQFALGDGVRNVRDPGTIADAIRFAFGKRELRRDFNRRVAAQLRTGAYDDAVDAVNDTAKGFREIFNKMHELASSAGVRGFTKAAVRNYMPRLWRFDKIRRLATTKEGKQDLINLIQTAIDQNGRKVVIDGVEETITGDLRKAATAFADRLISIAENTENAPMTQQDQELFDALQGLMGPLKAATSSRTPFGRGRILLNETASVRATADHFGDGLGDLSLAGLTNDDLPFVFRKYLTSVLGAVNERRLIDAFNQELKLRGIFSPKYRTADGDTVEDLVEANTVDEVVKLARKLGGPIGEQQESALREVIAAVRYEPIHNGAASVGDRILGVTLPLGYLVTGGQFGLAAMGEVARIVGTLGVRQTINQMPILKEMLTNFYNLDRESQNMASLLDSWFAPSTDRLRRSLFDPLGEGYRYDQSGTGGAIYRGTKRLLDGTSNVMSDISGLAPITSFTQQLAAATTMQHLYDVSKGVAKKLDNATVRSLGLEPEQYDTIISYVGRNAKTKQGFMGERIIGMDNVDAKDMDLLRAFVDRTVRTRVQDLPTRGDFHKLAFSFVGRLLTQFRTFNLKGIDNFLIQNATRINRSGGAKVAQEVAATMMFTGLIQYGRNYADWRSRVAAGDKEKAEEMEKLLTTTGFIRGALTGPSEFFLLGIGTDAAWTTFVDDDPLFSPYRYSGMSWYGFPGEALAARASGVFVDTYGATVGKGLGLDVERDVTRSTIRKARLLMPFQNMPIIKQYFNILEEDIATEFNLQRTQPRD